jgi:hypothetical protein
MGEDADVLGMLIEQNHNPLLGLQAGGDKDWEAGLILAGT